MPRGGRRPNSGRPPTAIGFRQWCRDVVLNPQVLRNLEEKAKTDVDIALKLAEHGFGRPPQSLDLKVSGDQDKPIVHRVAMPGGDPLSAAAAGLPDPGDAKHGEG